MMKNTQAPHYQNTPYVQPKVPAWLKKAVAPWVKLNRLYEAFFTRSFKAFELLAKPFFQAARGLELIAKKPGAFLMTAIVVGLVVVVKVNGVH